MFFDGSMLIQLSRCIMSHNVNKISWTGYVSLIFVAVSTGEKALWGKKLVILSKGTSIAMDIEFI